MSEDQERRLALLEARVEQLEAERERYCIRRSAEEATAMFDGLWENVSRIMDKGLPKAPDAEDGGG